MIWPDGGDPGADPRDLASAEAELGFRLPDDHRAILLAADGGEGWVGDHYLVLWRASELAGFNRDYELSSYAPGLIAFAGDGGGELFAYDARIDPPSVVVVPAIGMSLAEAHFAAPSLTGLLERMTTSDSRFD